MWFNDLSVKTTEYSSKPSGSTFDIVMKKATALKGENQWKAVQLYAESTIIAISAFLTFDVVCGVFVFMKYVSDFDENCYIVIVIMLRIPY
jgi:hypothetical protein